MAIKRKKKNHGIIKVYPGFFLGKKNHPSFSLGDALLASC
jgi:hypothetical protein